MDRRVDSSLRPGVEVGGAYDPTLSKVIAHGPDRSTALRRLDGALSEMTSLGVTTNVAFLRSLLRHSEVVASELDTGLVERELDGPAEDTVPDPVYVVAALRRVLELKPPDGVADPWDLPGGWRLAGRSPVDVRVRDRASAAAVQLGDGEPVRCALTRDATELPGDAEVLVLDYHGATQRYVSAGENGQRWLGRRGRGW